MNNHIRRILCVAEKNDAAKSISSLWSNGHIRRREGRSIYNKIYEFNSTFRSTTNCTFVFTSVSGHLKNYQFEKKYSNWNETDPKLLFEVPVNKNVMSDMEKIADTLRYEMQRCDALIIWTDCDREGENIGFQIIDVCRNSKRNNFPIWRAVFSEITKQAIERAVNNLQEPNENLSKAVEVRQELDLRIGAAFTRFQTLLLRKPSSNNSVIISYGSCQFPTLGFVVERYRQRKLFKSESFWSIEVLHQTSHDKENDDEKNVIFKWYRGRMFNHHICLAYLRDILQLEKEEEDIKAKVIDVKKNKKEKFRPTPLDTVELEKRANRFLKMSAKETMKIAESLYTRGFISYPRTETNQFASDIDLKKYVEKQMDDNRWSNFAHELFNGKIQPRNGKKSDKAHPPIHPLKAGSGLEGKDKQIYELVTRHFLATCSENAKGAETVISIEVNKEKFSTSGLEIYEKNYLKVYTYEKWSSKNIPNYRLNEIFTPNEINLSEGKTTAPSLLTEADLIALMDKYEIGTDATHAEHIDKIQKRNYVSLTKNNRLIPESLGLSLICGYEELGLSISKPFLRSSLEKSLKLISNGQLQSMEVLKEQINNYLKIFLLTTSNSHKLQCEIEKILSDLQIQQEINEIKHEIIRIANDNNSNNNHDDDDNDDNNNRKREKRSTGRKSTKSVNKKTFKKNPPPTTPTATTGEAIKCECNDLAKRLQVNKAGANKGKYFWVCPKPFSEENKCNFFKWDDQSNTNASAGKGRKCGICAQTGHTRRNCPNR
ncbi:hypothetical protein SNEBB_010803 [Seison nebaliae]|nr:hypothetical protein SNEBB_010803 [Seison nebaliae]